MRSVLECLGLESMTERFTITLAADYSGCNDFAFVGTMEPPGGPSQALLHDGTAGSECVLFRPFLLNTSLARVSGLCRLAADSVEQRLQEAAELNLVLEWRLMMGRFGQAKALFLITRLQAVDYSERLFHLTLELAGIPAICRSNIELEFAV